MTISPLVRVRPSRSGPEAGLAVTERKGSPLSLKVRVTRRDAHELGMAAHLTVRQEDSRPPDRRTV
ncbi:hypothetical protein GCM10018781_60520 [Kitasatospora indigofera]|uniref:Uncharacterized protein n=1 Tax=Kitasatospora indigofera TaxID=67307 RepID=A0A919G9C1_9ACTN|nr:hypothetical protein GCM10018781_60520 [Kitasatospora indigofera]